MAKTKYYISSSVSPSLNISVLPVAVPSNKFIEVGEDIFRTFEIQKLISNRVLTFKTEKVTEIRKSVAKEEKE